MKHKCIQYKRELVRIDRYNNRHNKDQVEDQTMNRRRLYHLESRQGPEPSPVVAYRRKASYLAMEGGWIILVEDIIKAMSTSFCLNFSGRTYIVLRFLREITWSEVIVGVGIGSSYKRQREAEKLK